MIIRFHGDLPELLARRFRGQERIEAPLGRRTSIKDLIESYDVPHTEIGRLTIEDRAVSFAHIVEEAEKIEVFPHQPPWDVFRPTLLRPEPLTGISFVVDQNVAKLAALLRLAGFDAHYFNGTTDTQLAEMTFATNRILLTKDKDLLKRKKVAFGRLVREIIPERQLIEVLTLFGLQGKRSPFSRCLRCNDGILEPVDKESIIHLLEPLTIKYYDHFRRCRRCRKIYWAGTHREKMEKLLEELGLSTKPGES